MLAITAKKTNLLTMYLLLNSYWLQLTLAMAAKKLVTAAETAPAISTR